jgi:hypothetical protein
MKIKDSSIVSIHDFISVIARFFLKNRGLSSGFYTLGVLRLPKVRCRSFAVTIRYFASEPLSIFATPFVLATTVVAG